MISVKDLKESDLFKGLDTKKLQRFVKHFTEGNFQAGEMIFLQGKPARNLYILLEGEVILGVYET